MTVLPDRVKDKQPPQQQLAAAVYPAQNGKAPDTEAAALAAYRCLLSCWNGSLPVQPRRILQGMPGVQVLDWEQTGALLRESGMDPDCVLMDWYGRIGAMKIDGQRDGKPMTGICLLPGLHPTEQRFALAHELGHILLEHLCESPKADAQANCFASHLLLPRPAALCLLPNGKLTQGDLPVMVRRFMVAPAVVRRAEREGWRYPDGIGDEVSRLFLAR